MKLKLSIITLTLLLTVLSPVKGDNPMDATDSTTVSQPETRKLGLFRRIIRGFDRIDERYIEPQHYVFTAMLQTSYTYENFQLTGNQQSVSFSPDGNVKVGPYFGWKWFFLGYTLSLNHPNFSNDRTEVELSIYSSQIGIDLIYRRTGADYKLRDMKAGGLDTKRLDNVSFDGVKTGITGFNIYYIFNHGRFSYPAAFAQSTCQKISCGSWLAGFGYMNNSIELDYEKLYELTNEKLAPQHIQCDSSLMFHSQKYYNISLSGGYAYNWVPARDWLLCASGQLALGYKKNYGNPSIDNGFSFKDLTPNVIGRFGLVYNNTRWYAGMSAYIYSNSYNKSRFSTHHLFGSMNMYVGYNFGLKKKYRNK